MIKEITACRICGNQDLDLIVDLGIQTLTGVFPKSKHEKITSGPLQLVKCREQGEDTCGLVQLRHSYDHKEMYGENYGYRSGLNASMVRHLSGITGFIVHKADLNPGDLIVDVGSNDATLLKSYPKAGYKLVGVDPTAEKFRSYYSDDIVPITEFFSANALQAHTGGQRAKVITSISMFYDLEEPMTFIRHIGDVLDDQGIWVFEQSYMPLMLERTAYDTICHEHLEYYGMKQIKWMLDRCGFKIVDVEFNDTNGGSFRITAAKNAARYTPCVDKVDSILQSEKRSGYDTLAPFSSFSRRIEDHKSGLLALLGKIKSERKVVMGYGASTKGNVIIQYCGLTPDDIPCIGEVNEDKFGAFTPNSNIPIISEKEMLAKEPDYLLVLPWHFRSGILEKENSFLTRGGRFIFPLPELEVVQA